MDRESHLRSLYNERLCQHASNSTLRCKSEQCSLEVRAGGKGMKSQSILFSKPRYQVLLLFVDLIPIRSTGDLQLATESSSDQHESDLGRRSSDLRMQRGVWTSVCPSRRLLQGVFLFTQVDHHFETGILLLNCTYRVRTVFEQDSMPACVRDATNLS